MVLQYLKMCLFYSLLEMSDLFEKKKKDDSKNTAETLLICQLHTLNPPPKSSTPSSARNAFCPPPLEVVHQPYEHLTVLSPYPLPHLRS